MKLNEKQLKEIEENGYDVLPLSQLKYDLDNHFEKGGYLLGHNIASFDLPVLKNSMDIYCIGKYLSQRKYIDTSRLISKDYGERFTLENLVSNTLGEHKLLESYMAPALWKAGEFDEVVKYCVDDCKLVYELWQHGKESNLKGFSIDKEEIVEMKMSKGFIEKLRKGSKATDYDCCFIRPNGDKIVVHNS